MIHFRRVKNRMTEKKFWHITEYKVNDVDSIPYINSKLDHPLGEYEMHFRGDQFAISTGGIISIKFSNHKKTIRTAFGGMPWGLTYPLLFKDFNDWIILKLERECLILELVKNNKKYRIKFETM